jgi:hypothetical protein
MTYALLGNVEDVVLATKADLARLADVGSKGSPIKKTWNAEPGLFGGKYVAQVIAGFSGRGNKPGVIRGYIPQEIHYTVRWYHIGVAARSLTIGWEEAEAACLKAFSHITDALEHDFEFRGNVRDYTFEQFESGATDRMGNPFIETVGRGQVNHLWRIQSVLRTKL